MEKKQTIKRIAIYGESGYGPYEEAYTDKFTIERGAAKYEYLPACKTEINPIRKWTYKTTSPLFGKSFDDACCAVRDILNSGIVVFCTDVGSIKFTVTFEDGTKKSKSFFCTGDEFKECFSILKRVVPDTEYIPAVLLTSDEYQE